jgi:hypothetical protein
LGKPISEKSCRQALPFAESFDFDGDGLNGVLDIRESLFQPILLVLAGYKGLLLGPNQPARPREGYGPNDRGSGGKKCHCHWRVRV